MVRFKRSIYQNVSIKCEAIYENQRISEIFSHLCGFRHKVYRILHSSLFSDNLKLLVFSDHFKLLVSCLASFVSVSCKYIYSLYSKIIQSANVSFITVSRIIKYHKNPMFILRHPVFLSFERYYKAFRYYKDVPGFLLIDSFNGAKIMLLTKEERKMS